jgi:hypothetical protein
MRDELITEAKGFAGTRPADDDITYIVVKWKPAATQQLAS